ncbi:hypothetical protein B0I37DRAFT_186517 [Chaetomium sp. MPI-CAGE-AT-0009]|nr:hypothetical protein B0I37DRAFT_186517 [Chaetomium sp. MPI-CAGE-AT-0009]
MSATRNWANETHGSSIDRSRVNQKKTRGTQRIFGPVCRGSRNEPPRQMWSVRRWLVFEAKGRDGESHPGRLSEPASRCAPAAYPGAGVDPISFPSSPRGVLGNLHNYQPMPRKGSRKLLQSKSNTFVEIAKTGRGLGEIRSWRLVDKSINGLSLRGYPEPWLHFSPSHFHCPSGINKDYLLVHTTNVRSRSRVRTSIKCFFSPPQKGAKANCLMPCRAESPLTVASLLLKLQLC